MTTTTNHIVAERFYDALCRGEPAALDALVDAELIFDSQTPGHPEGIEGLKHLMTNSRRAFPDFSMTMQDLIVAQDKAVGRLRLAGTHTSGEFMGMAPTGKSFVLEEIMIARIRNGRVIELWAVADRALIMQQLGALPAPAAAVGRRESPVPISPADSSAHP